MVINKRINKYHIYILSFLIPVIIASFSYYLLGIYPGGPNNILVYDMRAESLSLYGYLSGFGPGYDKIFHWMNGGLGGGFIGSAAMYLSFFDIIFFFVPVYYIPTAIYFLLIFKIGLCGLFFSVFIIRVFENRISFSATVLLSCCYALMSYVMTFSIILIWLDGVMLLPLLALFSEKIIKGEKSLFFMIFLSLCIIDDYYIAFMICITIALYVFFRLAENEVGKTVFLKRVCSFILHGILSAGISSVILLPVIYDLKRGKLSENVGISDGLIIKNSLTDCLKMMFPSNYANLGSNQPPYIFCGSVIVILTIVWIMYGKKNIRARIASCLIIFIYFSSFVFGPLDRVWHGFRDPIGFSCRYSFTFVFFMVCFASRGIISIDGSGMKLSSSLKKCLPSVVILYTVIELFMNSSFLLSKLMEDYVYSDSEEYGLVCDILNDSLSAIDLDTPSSYGRMVKNFNYSGNDGALFGYDGLDMFTSSYNGALIDFLRSLGINASVNFIKEPGITPPLADILNVRYYLSYWYDQSDYYRTLSDSQIFRLYENDNAMPFAYCVSDKSEERVFGNDPFENINAVYADIFGSDRDTAVYKECLFEYKSKPDDSYTSISVIPSVSGHYWIYPEYVYGNLLNGGSDYMPSDLKYLTYYVDGNEAGDCGFYNFRYCGDLGFLEAGKEYTVAFDSPSSFVGNIYLSYYDHELCSELISGLNGLEISEIGSDGIRLSGETDSSSDLIITLPYDIGYKVFVNGVKVDPGSYRNALLSIHLEKGINDVYIKYVPDGLIMGICLSIFSIVLCFLFLNISHEKKKIQ